MTPEKIELGAAIHKREDGTHTLTIQVRGLKEGDAKQISVLLQPLVNQTVEEVLKQRGHVHGDYQPPGKAN
jgi:hypothetical protein